MRSPRPQRHRAALFKGFSVGEGLQKCACVRAVGPNLCQLLTDIYVCVCFCLPSKMSSNIHLKPANFNKLSTLKDLFSHFLGD